jgi:hypothetical protein
VFHAQRAGGVRRHGPVRKVLEGKEEC